MSCAACKREIPPLARGLCKPCYERLRRTGSTEYSPRTRAICSVGGCDKAAVSKGLCDTHRKRMERHGHLNETRPDSWGAIKKHPLRNTWGHLRRHAARHPVEPVWLEDFLQFVADVGDRPSAKHKLFSADESRPIGPDNFVWKRAVTERAPGEDEKTYRNRLQKTYRALRPEAFKGYELKRRFGLSEEDFAKMLAEQGGLCAICGKPESAKHRKGDEARTLAVDHCHSGGHVRALLCSACNTGLGSFGDDPDRLRAAIEYLERHTPPS